MSVYSRINSRIIINITGFLLILEGFFMIFGLAFTLLYNEYSMSLLYSGLITSAAGFLLWFITRKGRKNIGKREGYIIVSTAWIVISLFGTLPYLLSGA
ncbi:MAG: TrkH family potassium uptake protein, partial [Bacteroidales bacterium]|nr:TrkH family potassium uptake protein [Bacteroidales bacterium]